MVANMLLPHCEFDAVCLWDALNGVHKDPRTIAEILCTRTNEEIEQIKEAYLLRFKVITCISDVSSDGEYIRISSANVLNNKY